MQREFIKLRMFTNFLLSYVFADYAIQNMNYHSFLYIVYSGIDHESKFVNGSWGPPPDFC